MKGVGRKFLKLDFRFETVFRLSTVILLGTLLSFDSLAHFVQILPERDPAQSGNSREIEILIRFAHPFEQTLMDMEQPESLIVKAPDGTHDLSATLQAETKTLHRFYRSHYSFTRPGDYLFLLKPKAYFEPAERKFIRHFTKLVVNVGGVEGEWDALIGVPVEIIPLTRPYGLWRGNLFTGRVLVEGKPAVNTLVEVAYENRTKKIAPTPLHRIQTLKTDSEGVFSYAMPFAGWWGFAALIDAKEGIQHEDGETYPVELGGLIWVHAESPAPESE